MKKILVIDDEEILTRTFARLLERCGYEVYTVCHGHDALALVGEEELDLIICDIRMPGMNGVEVIKMIKKEGIGKNKTVPVIFVTGFADENLKIEAMQLLPAAYLHKPFDVIDLKERVGKILGQ